MSEKLTSQKFMSFGHVIYLNVWEFLFVCFDDLQIGRLGWSGISTGALQQCKVISDVFAVTLELDQ
jgi:hypothetical protein